MDNLSKIAVWANILAVALGGIMSSGVIPTNGWMAGLVIALLGAANGLGHYNTGSK